MARCEGSMMMTGAWEIFIQTYFSPPKEELFSGKVGRA